MRCHLLGMPKLKADGHFSRMPLFLHFCVNVATCGKRFGSVGSVGAEIQSPDLAIHPLSASSLPFDQLWAHQSSITWFLCCHVAVSVRTDTGSFYKIFRARRIWKVPEGCHAMWCCSFGRVWISLRFGRVKEVIGGEGFVVRRSGPHWTGTVCPAKEVNMKFFDMFKKPVDFFPHKLQAMDTGLDLQSCTRIIDTHFSKFWSQVFYCISFWNVVSIAFVVYDGCVMLLSVFQAMYWVCAPTHENIGAFTLSIRRLIARFSALCHRNADSFSFVSHLSSRLPDSSRFLWIPYCLLFFGVLLSFILVARLFLCFDLAFLVFLCCHKEICRLRRFKSFTQFVSPRFMRRSEAVPTFGGRWHRASPLFRGEALRWQGHTRTAHLHSLSQPRTSVIS